MIIMYCYIILYHLVHYILHSLILLFYLVFFSFRTGKGLGYSAHFSGPMLVLECTVKAGKKENKVFHHLVKFEFHPQKVTEFDEII